MPGGRALVFPMTATDRRPPAEAALNIERCIQQYGGARERKEPREEDGVTLSTPLPQPVPDRCYRAVFRSAGAMVCRYCCESANRIAQATVSLVTMAGRRFLSIDARVETCGI